MVRLWGWNGRRGSNNIISQSICLDTISTIIPSCSRTVHLVHCAFRLCGRHDELYQVWTADDFSSTDFDPVQDEVKCCPRVVSVELESSFFCVLRDFWCRFRDSGGRLSVKSIRLFSEMRLFLDQPAPSAALSNIWLWLSLTGSRERVSVR